MFYVFLRHKDKWTILPEAGAFNFWEAAERRAVALDPKGLYAVFYVPDHYAKSAEMMTMFRREHHVPVSIIHLGKVWR